MLTESAAVGLLLRHWRRHLSLSQLDLAVTAEISVRHLSFIETGRARASRAVIDRLADALKLDVENANALRLGAGFAPVRTAPVYDSPASGTASVEWAGPTARHLSVEEQAAVDLLRQASAWEAAHLVYVGAVVAIDAAPEHASPDACVFVVRITAEHALKGRLSDQHRICSFHVAAGSVWSAFHGSQVGDRVIVYADRHGPSDRSDRVMLNRLRHPPTLQALAASSG